MRTIRIIFILAILIGFPALSWFYLNSGLKWRLHAQEETAVKGTLKDFVLEEPDSLQVSSAQLKGRYHLFAAPVDSTSLAHLKMVNTQFHVREDFNTICILPESGSLPAMDSTWISARCLSGCNELLTTLFSPDFTATIVDDSLHVRGRYHLGSMDDMRKLVEHLAVVLPIDKREKIELKRGVTD